MGITGRALIVVSLERKEKYLPQYNNALGLSQQHLRGPPPFCTAPQCYEENSHGTGSDVILTLQAPSKIDNSQESNLSFLSF